VAVTQNSQVLDDAALNSEEIQMVYQHCIKAAELIGIKAPIRIDCRANEKGQYFLFDLNLKPNMTVPSRSHRKNQDSLTLLAAKKIGWNYFDLLNNILGQKWNLKYNYE
jgi:carbamoylphosphate synthase large subunit